MTRGKLILLLPGDTYLITDEFNGDMYLHGKGSIAIVGLENIKDIGGFRALCENFNKQHYEYEDFEIHEESYGISDLNTITFEADNYYDFWFSDYLYFKNLTSELFTFIDRKNQKIILEPNGIAVFQFGERYLKMFPDNEEQK